MCCICSYITLSIVMSPFLFSFLHFLFWHMNKKKLFCKNYLLINVDFTDIPGYHVHISKQATYLAHIILTFSYLFALRTIYMLVTSVVTWHKRAGQSTRPLTSAVFTAPLACPILMLISGVEHTWRSAFLFTL